MYKINMFGYTGNCVNPRVFSRRYKNSVLYGEALYDCILSCGGKAIAIDLPRVEIHFPGIKLANSRLFVFTSNKVGSGYANPESYINLCVKGAEFKNALDFIKSEYQQYQVVVYTPFLPNVILPEIDIW
jgi:hypothetical protein